MIGDYWAEFGKKMDTLSDVVDGYNTSLQTTCCVAEPLDLEQVALGIQRRLCERRIPFNVSKVAIFEALGEPLCAGIFWKGEDTADPSSAITW